MIGGKQTRTSEGISDGGGEGDIFVGWHCRERGKGHEARQSKICTIAKYFFPLVAI